MVREEALQKLLPSHSSSLPTINPGPGEDRRALVFVYVGILCKERQGEICLKFSQWWVTFLFTSGLPS